ncbi:MAG: CocE/NonD family hydrolase [Puniceicoccaceae bacterium]|nr:MAG: CocE/NonD family hydrolase [Puniceicoccaceae bacterium]
MGEYYGYWGRDQLLKINGWVNQAADPDQLYIELYRDHRWLDRLLEQFPSADEDGDGTISPVEAVRWHARRVPLITPGQDLLKWLPAGVSQWKEQVAMSDGTILATQVYLPAGEGPFPVLVGRGIRQGGQMDCAHWYLAKGFACVSQDLVPEEERLERGMHGGRSIRRRDPAPDTRDLLAWVTGQAWCNGRIALFGYSAGGMATLPVLNLRPPELSAIVTHIASADAAGIFRLRGGVSSQRHYNPEDRGSWTPALPESSGQGGLRPVLPEEQVATFKTDLAGWFDIFLQGSIDDWLAWKATGRAVLVIGAGSHGPHPRPSRVPPDYCDADIFWPDVPQFNLLTDGVDPDSVRSVLLYFQMGDFLDPLAPGNRWMIAQDWPPPFEERSFYLTSDHRLNLQPSDPTDASIDYTYDPRDPVVRVDMGWKGLIADGPADQRPLRKRPDVVFFASEVLDHPLGITGRIRAELFISTDVPDTTFMVKLLDIYPDGYEAMIAHGVLMARYHRSLNQPEPLRPGQIYRLEIDLWSTALVFNQGHRIGLFVTSSDAGRFAVHPNTYDPIESYEESKVARQRLHVSASHPSRLILPVTPVDAGTVFDPKVHALCRKLAAWDK